MALPYGCCSFPARVRAISLLLRTGLWLTAAVLVGLPSSPACLHSIGTLFSLITFSVPI